MGNLGEGSPPPAARWRETTFKSEQTVRARGTDLGRVMRRGMETGVDILQRKRCGQRWIRYQVQYVLRGYNYNYAWDRDRWLPVISVVGRVKNDQQPGGVMRQASAEQNGSLATIAIIPYVLHPLKGSALF